MWSCECPRASRARSAVGVEYVQKSLSVRTHLCPSCGLVEDRDVNAARNILRAGAPPSRTGRDAAPVEARSPRL